MMNSIVLRALLTWMPNNAESICRKVGEKLGRPVLHAFITHCGTYSVRIAPRKTLTDSYTRFLPETQSYLNLMTRTPKSKPYYITLPKYAVLIHWWVLYAIFLLCWSTPCFITLLRYTQQSHIAELYLILGHCFGIPNFITLLPKTVTQYIAGLYPIVTHCWGIANIKILLSYILS